MDGNAVALHFSAGEVKPDRPRGPGRETDNDARDHHDQLGRGPPGQRKAGRDDRGADRLACPTRPAEDLIGPVHALPFTREPVSFLWPARRPRAPSTS